MRLFIPLILSALCSAAICPGNAQPAERVRPYAIQTTIRGEGVDIQCSGWLIPERGAQDYTADSWVWEFGDGHTAEGITVRHRYDAPGKYKLCLSAAGPEGRTRYCHMLEIGDSEPTTRPGMQVSYMPAKGMLFTWFDSPLGMGAMRIADSSGGILWEGPLSIENMEIDVSRVKPGRYTFTVRQPWIAADRFDLEIGQ